MYPFQKETNTAIHITIINPDIMPSIQHTFNFENQSEHGDLENVQIVVVFPRFSFNFSHQITQRFVSDQITFTISHDPEDTEYGIKIPLSKIIGTNTTDIYGFYLYHFIEILNPDININDFSIPFTILIKDNKGNEIHSESFSGILYQKKSPSSDYDARNYQEEKFTFTSKYGTIGELNTKGLKALPKAIDREVFLLNKEPYELAKSSLTDKLLNGSEFENDRLLLEFIEILTEFGDTQPKLISQGDEVNKKELMDFFTGIQNTSPFEVILKVMKPFIDPLYDFPLSLSAVDLVSIAGSVKFESQNELTTSDLDFYDLIVEYNQKNSSPVILPYNWSTGQNELTDYKIDFSYVKDSQIVANNISGLITVKLKGYDGAILWEKKFDPDDRELNNILIEIKAYPTEKISYESGTGKPKSTKRLRGKVLQQGTAHDLNDLTIVVQANTEENENLKIVSAGKTDNSGNFSIDYPFGDFKSAKVTVSLMPDHPANIEIVNKPNETISDEFIFLLLSDAAVVLPSDSEESGDHEDCGCDDSTTKINRLPDQADLIESDEYTQDIGGGCINLSTPNRTLKEYNYNAIVRTSDPEVANYELEKSEEEGKVKYNLVRSSESYVRKEINLANPIRWQDAPEAEKELSLYQAVTVATGHIIYYKSVFKADGYSLGDLVYSLPLAPGQKKQIVVFESSHSLMGAESQSISQGESLTAGLISDRYITDQIGGGINESVSGSSKAHTSGMSAGLGAAGSYGGIGASLGIAGGFSNSNSSASQNSSRNISQFFDEKLRQSLMQNAESYRELNSSVVTTVTENQSYGVTAETIANHNHCHSLTMMYFEVLRHFAVYQEVASVEECVFVPLLLTQFSTENISKWKDILATNLLPIPSNTYLNTFANFFGRRNHPLLKAFDANERIKTKYSRVDFPSDSYSADNIRTITGEFTIRINLERPKTRYDRILSFPKTTRTVVNKEVDVFETAKAWFNPFDWNKTKYKYTTETIIENAKIFDSFMKLDADFQSKKPADSIRVLDFKPVPYPLIPIPGISPSSVSGDDFFEGDVVDKNLWIAYANILEHTDVFEMLNNYFKGALISEWDDIFKNQMLPEIFEKILDTIKVDAFSWQLNNVVDYKGGERRIRVRINEGNYSGSRKSLPRNIRIKSESSIVNGLDGGFTRLDIENIRINYSTDFFDGILFNGYKGDNLLDGVPLDIPLTTRDKINPRKEDEYIVNELIEHLNSNLEYYNKVLWRNLDPDRRYMLLDGFNIQTYTTSGHKSVMRSLASVIKNELITIAGNSLVFPVASGYRIGRNSMLEQVGEDEFVETNLLDYYKPLTPMPPYRLSVPTRGVFMEAIMGHCDACEMVKENSSQDWDKFKTEETTSIQPILTPTPTITEYKPEYKDFAQPLVNIQNAPDAPAPAAGLAGLGEILSKANAFNDITGLAGNQTNALETFKENTKAAQEYAKMATGMVNQQHNTKNADDIQNRIDQAKKDGNLTEKEAKELTRQHLQQQIDGGTKDRDSAQLDREKNRTSLSDIAADAANSGRNVEAERTDSDGTNEKVNISGEGSNNLVDIVRPIQAMSQTKDSDCWAVAATIMMNWKNSRSSTVEDVLINAGNNLDPVNENYYLEIYNNDTGLYTSEKSQFINSLGMTDEAPANYSADDFIGWLDIFGPLWITGDDDTSGGFSPHARILYKISGDKTDLNNLMFYFIDPSNGQSIDENFTTFINRFEQMVSDLGNQFTLFTQVVRFNDQIVAPSEGQGGSRELYRNDSIGSRLITGDTVQSHQINVDNKTVRLGGISYRLWNRAQWGIVYGGKNISAFKTSLKDLAATYRAEGGDISQFKALAALGFEVVSEHEGKVTAINTWDNKDFTWGAGFASERLNSFLEFLPKTGGLADLLNRIPWLRGNQFNRELFRNGPEHLDIDNFHLLVRTIENNNTFYAQLTNAQARQFTEKQVMARSNTPNRIAMMKTIGTSTIAPVVGIAGYLNHGRPAYARIPVEMLNSAIIEGGNNYTKQVAVLFRIYIQTVNRAALRINREARLDLIYNTLATRVPNKIKAFNAAMRKNGFPNYEFDFREASTILPCINENWNMSLLDGPDNIRKSPLLMWVHSDTEYPDPNISMNYDTRNNHVIQYRGYYNLGEPLTVPEI